MLNVFREDLAEDVVDGLGPAEKEHMTTARDEVSGFGEVDREDFVPGAMNMIKGRRDFGVFPFQDRIEGPFDESVVSVFDHLQDQAFVFRAFHGERMLNAGGDL